MITTTTLITEADAVRALCNCKVLTSTNLTEQFEGKAMPALVAVKRLLKSLELLEGQLAKSATAEYSALTAEQQTGSPSAYGAVLRAYEGKTEYAYSAVVVQLEAELKAKKEAEKLSGVAKKHTKPGNTNFMVVLG